MVSSIISVLRNTCHQHYNKVLKSKSFSTSRVDEQLICEVIANDLRQTLDGYLKKCEQKHGPGVFPLSFEDKKNAVNAFQEYANRNVSTLGKKIRDLGPNTDTCESRRYWGNVRTSMRALMKEYNAREYKKLEETHLIGPQKRPKRVTFGGATVQEFYSEDWAVKMIRRAIRKRHGMKTKAVFLITRAMRALAERKEEERKEKRKKEEGKKAAKKKRKKFVGAPRMSKRLRKK